MLMIAVIPIMIYQVQALQGRGGCSMSQSTVPRLRPATPPPRPQAQGARTATRNPAKAGWFTKIVARRAVPRSGSSRCWGTLITSFRPLRRRGDSRLVDGRSTHPATWSDFTLEQLQRGAWSARRTWARRSSTASRSRCPATFIPILIAAFAAYAFTFMEFWGRDVLFLAIVSLLVVPNYVAFVPLLKIYGTARHDAALPGGVAGPHRVRHVAGDLHPAQLHGDAAARR